MRNLTLKKCNEENQFEPIQKLISVIEIRVYEYLKLQNKNEFEMTSKKNNFGKRKSYYREKKMTYAGK